MSTTSDPVEFEHDIMVQSSSTYLKSQQIDLVLTLLEEYVDPNGIPEYVRKKVSGVDLTVDDVLAIKDGHFHVSGSDFDVKMMTSGNLISINVVDDFFIVLPAMPTLHHVRTYIEEEYGFVIDDNDLIDLYDGSFTIAGPETIDVTTKSNYFVPRTVCSEILWMVENGCSAEFLTKYVWYRYHSHLPPYEVIDLVLNHDLEMAIEGGLSVLSQDLEMAIEKALSVVSDTRRSTSSFNPPCLKQTPRRRQPPLPIITTDPMPRELRLYAERVVGETYTANPCILCHNADGTYTTVAEFLADEDADGESLSRAPTCSGECNPDADGESISRTPSRFGESDRNADGESLSRPPSCSGEVSRLLAAGNDRNFDHALPIMPGTYVHTPSGMGPAAIDINADADNDDNLVLQELGLTVDQQAHGDFVTGFDRPSSRDIAWGTRYPLQPHARFYNHSPSVYSEQDTVAGKIDDGESTAFGQEIHANSTSDDDSSSAEVDLEMGILHNVKAQLETDLENGNLISEQRARNRESKKRQSLAGGCGTQVQ